MRLLNFLKIINRCHSKKKILDTEPELGTRNSMVLVRIVVSVYDSLEGSPRNQLYFVVSIVPVDACSVNF